MLQGVVFGLTSRSRTVRDFVTCKAGRHGFGLRAHGRGTVGAGKLGVAVFLGLLQGVVGPS